MTRGRAPQPADSHSRYRPRKVLPLPDGEQVHGWPLPDEDHWPAATRRWWEAWRESAMAGYMTEVDWQSLFLAARLHARLFDVDLSVAAEVRLTAEIRQRESLLGGSVESRKRLHMTAPTPAAPARPRPASVVDYRERLAGAG